MSTPPDQFDPYGYKPSTVNQAPVSNQGSFDPYEYKPTGKSSDSVKSALTELNAPTNVVSKGINTVLNYPGKLLQEQTEQHPIGPLFKLPANAQSPDSQALLKTAQSSEPAMAGAIGTIGSLYGLRGLKPSGTETFGHANALEQGHPLTTVAQSEIDEMQQHLKAAKAAGVDIPPREVTPAQQYVNDAARTDLNLPKNAPVTSGLLDAARRQNVGPAYEAARSVPAYELSPNYTNAIKKVDLEKIDPEMRPPIDGSMTGQQAVDLSQNLRHEASRWWDFAEGSGGPPARATAKAYTSAYKAVEGSFRESAPGEIADNWDAARTYAAKTYAWEDTLDGAGNASGPKIKKLLLQGEPISGPMKEAASVVAQAPEVFRSTRLQSPTEGLVKRGIRGVAPIAGAALGEAVIPGSSLAAGGGAALGESFANTVLGPRPRR